MITYFKVSPTSLLGKFNSVLLAFNPIHSDSWHFQNPKPKTQVSDPSLVTMSRNEKLLIITPYSLRNVIHREAANEFLEDDMLWFYSLMKPYYMMIDKLTFLIGHSSKKGLCLNLQTASNFAIIHKIVWHILKRFHQPSTSYISEEWSLIFFILLNSLNQDA